MTLSDREVEDCLNQPLPDWATGLAHGRLCLGAQLCTRDGRRTGNAHIIQIAGPRKGYSDSRYLVMTDAGNTFVMSAVEIRTAYYDPYYFSDVKDIIAKFWYDPGDPPVLL